ncbi:MAG: SufE family protein [Verrucomicrobia bacterium]|nr:SufE family protein [Verrucomicrobiota bacterium]
MFPAIETQIEALRALFSSCQDPLARYEKIIEMGQKAPPMSSEHKLLAQLVPGCQSKMYLYSALKDNKIYFEAESDALISQGLAALLIQVYNEQPAEAILKHRPTFLQELHITESLSPTRTNGLASLHLMMQRAALAFLSAN